MVKTVASNTAATTTVATAGNSGTTCTSFIASSIDSALQLVVNSCEIL